MGIEIDIFKSEPDAICQSAYWYDDKIKIVLNKADKVKRVYLGSFWNGSGLQNPDTEKLLHAEMVDLIKELLMLPKNAAIRKVNDLVKRARTTKVHALIVSHLCNEMPPDEQDLQ
ncbi:hypothetical protein DFA_02427 [Cavenderia fasciculata]|uniref:DUF5600 domain-containing protein n=1 Tax=Cavenderia fasciculata TaxID=261658 RepID=F4PZF0_CACFS|nr:uncharacterized protein DFA_02427 [Cavenderia fasciculata]EGG19179.1 hypothetical protein DFA_02427 [Cavenderia fasciculata]|eukprot:XP_004366812.1 hypothetical protein DFA_02427 [Cavenderia fasciculata]